jgi:protein SCO1/2
VPTRRLPLLLLTLVLAVGGCGGSSGEKKETGTTAKGKAPSYQGAVATPPKPVPPLVLKDSTGKTVDISKFRGKAVLVTWLYVHCPDVCPLIAGNIHTALAKLGAKASDVKVIAVSTDPRGDKPATVEKFLAEHQVKGEMTYLVGSKQQLQAAWKNWGIVARPDKSNPERVEHSAPIYGVSASGKITTLYPANFKPAMIVHDAPLLAAQ